MDLGPVGIWSMDLDRQPLAAAQAAVTELDELGFPVLWIPEAVGKEVMSHAALLLCASPRIVVATGIANLWARDATAMVNAQRTLTEGFPERFILGVGISHKSVVAHRGHTAGGPLQITREYLDAMDAASYVGPQPTTKGQRVLAALGPKMLDLAAERTDGAHTYTVPVEHTAFARARLGAGPQLVVEQKVVLVEDAAEARRIARRNMKQPLRLPNYANNLRRFGFSDDDLAEGGSNRLVDALVAHGGLGEVHRRIEEHLAAGASQVALQVLTADPSVLPLAEWRELSALLKG
jgi:probable F420-dependent oxidoreductase